MSGLTGEVRWFAAWLASLFDAAVAGVAVVDAAFKLELFHVAQRRLGVRRDAVYRRQQNL